MKTKTGKTFLERKQILSILGFGKIADESRWMTTRDIVNVANAMGWTTPMDDPDRLAVSHPYSKVLSMMTDIFDDTYYSPSVMCRKSPKKGHKAEFKLA